jgi:hypothetical protein
MSNQTPARVDKIGSRIRTIRGKKVILDFDLAEIYGVLTKIFSTKRSNATSPDSLMILSFN